MLILITELFLKQSKPTKHFQSNSLGFLIGLNASVCARNFTIFCGTLQIRWRQLSWASIAVRENCLENSQVILKRSRKLDAKLKKLEKSLDQAWAK
jgi:hypothetical protein